MKAILDTGVIVALLDRRDSHHQDARERLGTLPRPWSICEAVAAETFFLLAKAKGGSDAFIALLASGAIVVDYSMRGDEAVIAARMKKYASVPMSVADACLVRMCELTKHAKLVTFDSDFRIYRLPNRRAIPQ